MSTWKRDVTLDGVVVISEAQEPYRNLFCEVQDAAEYWTLKERFAHADLAAAALELLDALKAVKSLFASSSPFYIQKLDAPITNGDQERIDRVFIAIDAAITKAEAYTGAAK